VVAIRHFVVLMLENRSFDSMLGALYRRSEGFDGLTGEESNRWQRPDDTTEIVPVWNDPGLTPESLSIPDPDPGESFDDIAEQIRGGAAFGAMGGFVANYMRQPLKAGEPARDPRAVMHYVTPAQLPVLSALARAFGVSDRWHASAPCQTWPNRFFAHAGTAGGKENNTPGHLFEMPTVFNALSEIDVSWRIYFHDIPQCAALTRLWPHALTHFSRFEDFRRDAGAGTLPAYSFLEPRYFADALSQQAPNDQHPPHNLSRGEVLIAEVYNALRQGPGWDDTLLLVTYDEHGGCFDHVVPPAATPPGDVADNGYRFDSFGVRVPAVVVSPRIRPGSVLRPAGAVPFDHTSIIATLRELHGIGPLTPRDAAAPSLVPFLGAAADNPGPPSLDATPPPATVEETARLAARPPSDLQRSLSHVALRLPAGAAQLGAHLSTLRHAPPAAPEHASVAEALEAVSASVRRFLESV
jgi:phospholipase C